MTDRPTTRTCPVCGQTFQAAGAPRSKRYCSPKCKKRAYYHRKRAASPTLSAECQHCGRAFQYRRKSKAKRYCSPACARGAYKARQLQSLQALRASPPEAQRPEWPFRGTTTGSLARSLADKDPIHCHVCGRPLAPDEYFGRWRIRAIKISPRYVFEFITICPLHYPED